MSDDRKIQVISAVSMIQICEKFGWDYYTFISQPAFFVETIDNYYRAIQDIEKNNG